MQSDPKLQFIDVHTSDSGVGAVLSHYSQIISILLITVPTVL